MGIKEGAKGEKAKRAKGEYTKTFKLVPKLHLGTIIGNEAKENNDRKAED
jgi:hypothetical protein